MEMRITNPLPIRLWAKSGRGTDDEKIVFVNTDELTVEAALDLWIESDHPAMEGRSGYEPIDPDGGEAFAAAADRLEEINGQIRRLEAERATFREMTSVGSDAQVVAGIFIRSPYLRWPGPIDSSGHQTPIIGIIFRALSDLDRQVIAASHAVVGWKQHDPVRRVGVTIRRTPDGYSARFVRGTSFTEESQPHCFRHREEWDDPDAIWVFTREIHAIRAIVRDVSGRTDLPETRMWRLDVDLTAPVED